MQCCFCLQQKFVSRAELARMSALDLLGPHVAEVGKHIHRHGGRIAEEGERARQNSSNHLGDTEEEESGRREAQHLLVGCILASLCTRYVDSGATTAEHGVREL